MMPDFARILPEYKNLSEFCTNVAQFLPELDTLAKVGGGAQCPMPPVSYAFVL